MQDEGTLGGVGGGRILKRLDGLNSYKQSGLGGGGGGGGGGCWW